MAKICQLRIITSFRDFLYTFGFRKWEFVFGYEWRMHSAAPERLSRLCTRTHSSRRGAHANVKSPSFRRAMNTNSPSPCRAPQCWPTTRCSTLASVGAGITFSSSSSLRVGSPWRVRSVLVTRTDSRVCFSALFSTVLTIRPRATANTQRNKTGQTNKHR